MYRKLFQSLAATGIKSYTSNTTLSTAISSKLNSSASSCFGFQSSQFYSKDTNKIKVTFKKFSGEEITVHGKEGDTLLDLVVNNNLDFDGYGACEGTLTCSTCHVILKQEDFDRLPSKPTDEELDMLDLAYDLADTSRLGCQILLSKDLDGLVVQVPATVNDARGS